MINLSINGQILSVVSSIFPGGEVNTKILPPTQMDFSEPERFQSFARIWANLKSSDDVMELLMTTDAVRRMYPGIIVDLEMPYIPYARQDRVMTEGEALSIKVFADLINAQNYRVVSVWDPHSDVAPALLNNVTVRKPIVSMRNLPRTAFNKSTIFISPDAGANKKVFDIARQLGIKEVVRADKTRNVATGAITDTVIYGDVKDRDTFIVDDICDGGYTFIALGKALKKLGAAKVSLFVTHGIFSKGLDPLREAIDCLYCENSWLTSYQNIRTNLLAAPSK